MILVIALIKINIVWLNHSVSKIWTIYVSGFFLVNTFQLRVIHTYTWAGENERSSIGYVAVDSVIG